MAIRLLPPELVKQIAAGEVIERPASVVKELLENALDAGAQRIEIELEGGGLEKISVRDDGCGIAGDELALALTPHATSKIASFDDFSRLHSLGFRGEALASIAAVSRLSLASCVQGAAHGWALTAGERAHPMAHPVGTTCCVRDLFYNVPARKKFLKSARVERAHILELLQALALSASVHLVVRESGRVLGAWDGRDFTATAGAILGAAFVQTAQGFDECLDGRRCWGLLGSPNCSAAHSGKQFLFVNGRWVQDKMIAHALREAYQDQLFHRRHAQWVLHLVLPPEEVDVNAHPRKTEVRFRHPEAVHQLCLQSVRRCLRTQVAAAPALAEPPAPYEVRPKMPPLGEALGQIARTFIVANAPGGLVLVDLHAAHERILYERLKRQPLKAETVALTPAEGFALAPEDVETLDAHRTRLKAMGFAWTWDGAQLTLTQAPKLLATKPLRPLWEEVLAELRQYPTTEALSRAQDRVLASMACHAALKAGAVLSLEEMNALLRALENTPAGGQCNHGRPTWIALDVATLNHLFLRGAS